MGIWGLLPFLNEEDRKHKRDRGVVREVEREAGENPVGCEVGGWRDKKARVKEGESQRAGHCKGWG